MKVHIIGEDNRSVCLRKIYKENLSKIEDANIIFCPIPFSKDEKKINNSDITLDYLIEKLKDKEKILVSGAINKNVIDKLEENNIDVIDIMNYEEFSIKNAQATAEGAIRKALEMTDFTLNNSNILILGYGRIGKCLARILEGFGTKIYCEARKKRDIAIIKSMGYNEVDLKDIDTVLSKADVIFNTIPSMILDKKRIELLKRDVCVIDLASAPGGVDFEELYKRKINTCWYLAVPSKDSPYSAAQYIKETIDDIIGEEDTWERKLT